MVVTDHRKHSNISINKIAIDWQQYPCLSVSDRYHSLKCTWQRVGKSRSLQSKEWHPVTRMKLCMTQWSVYNCAWKERRKFRKRFITQSVYCKRNTIAGVSWAQVIVPMQWYFVIIVRLRFSQEQTRPKTSPLRSWYRCFYDQLFE